MTHESPVQGLMRLPEAARFLGVSRSKVYRLMDSGELPFVKLGKARRITWNELNKLVERHTHTGPELQPQPGHDPEATK